MFTEPRRLSPRVHTVPPRRTAAFIDHRLDGMAVVSRSDIAKIKILEPVFAPPCDAILPEFCGVLRSEITIPENSSLRVGEREPQESISMERWLLPQDGKPCEEIPKSD